jgi:DNA-directed RNA polymerase subunit beta
VNGQTGEIIIGANKKITKTLLRKLAESYDTSKSIRARSATRSSTSSELRAEVRFDADMERERNLDRIEAGNEDGQ